LKPALAVAIVLLAAGGGVGLWLATRSTAEPEPAVETSTPRDAAVEERLQRAVALLKGADEREGPDRTARAKEAGAILQELEQSGPRDADVVFWRGIAASYAGDGPVARAALERLVTIVPARSAQAKYLQAVMLLLTEPKKPEQAVRLLRGLPSSAPKFLPEAVRATTYVALRASAEKSLAERSPDAAIEALNEAKRLAKDIPGQLLDTRMFIARALALSHRYVESQEEWERLHQETKGEVPGIEFGLATVHAGQNDWSGAVVAFTRTLELVDREKVQTQALRSLREALLRRGNAYRLLGEHEKARADLERYVAEFPDDSRGHYWLGFFRLDALEDAKGAREELERARTLAPYCDETLVKLLQLYEVALPDADRAKALRATLEDGAKERAQAREEAARRRGDGSDPCS
jgi:tetratricopeptide (TPR) repeat protein